MKLSFYRGNTSVILLFDLRNFFLKHIVLESNIVVLLAYLSLFKIAYLLRELLTVT